MLDMEFVNILLEIAHSFPHVGQAVLSWYLGPLGLVIFLSLLVYSAAIRVYFV